MKRDPQTDFDEVYNLLREIQSEIKRSNPKSYSLSEIIDALKSVEAAMTELVMEEELES